MERDLVAVARLLGQERLCNLISKQMDRLLSWLWVTRLNYAPTLIDHSLKPSVRYRRLSAGWLVFHIFFFQRLPVTLGRQRKQQHGRLDDCNSSAS